MSEDYKTKTGYDVSALFRAYLNLVGLPWADCEKWGIEFDSQIQSADWLHSDTGTTFTRSFDPKEEIK
jgi:hypothetical protein